MSNIERPLLGEDIMDLTNAQYMGCTYLGGTKKATAGLYWPF